MSTAANHLRPSRRTHPETHDGRAPFQDFLGARQMDEDFEACGEIEYEELDEYDPDAEMALLESRVRAAREFGA